MNYNVKPNGFRWNDPNFILKAVWVQAGLVTSTAAAYQTLGMNAHVYGAHDFTHDELLAWGQAGIGCMISQTTANLALAADSTVSSYIKAWHSDVDEPDNARGTGGNWTTGSNPPNDPASMLTKYNSWVAADPTRDVSMNMGEGMANELWIGHGTGWPGPQEYLLYGPTADVFMCDVYPKTNLGTVNGGLSDQGSDSLWFQQKLIQRLKCLVGGPNVGKKPLLGHIDFTHISHTGVPRQSPSIAEIQAEIMMLLMEGARGYVLFCHEFDYVPDADGNSIATVSGTANAGQPVVTFSADVRGATSHFYLKKAGLSQFERLKVLSDAGGVVTCTSNLQNTWVNGDLVLKAINTFQYDNGPLRAQWITQNAALIAFNARLDRMAWMINSDNERRVKVISTSPATPLQVKSFRRGTTIYIIVQSLRNQSCTATFKLNDSSGTVSGVVVEESRSLTTTNGQFTDTFNAYDLHVYQFELGAAL